METLLKEINKLIEEKNLEIFCLKAENERLRKENAELKQDIEKYDNFLRERSFRWHITRQDE
jgi:cell division protein FtsB